MTNQFIYIFFLTLEVCVFDDTQNLTNKQKEFTYENSHERNTFE